MTKDKAIFEYFNNFMQSFPATSVPEEAQFPWLSYEIAFGSFGDGDYSIRVSIFDYTESEAGPNKLADDLRHYIEEHDTIKCEEGRIWVKPGTPWCQALNDDVNPSIKRRLINIDIEYLTI